MSEEIIQEELDKIMEYIANTNPQIERFERIQKSMAKMIDPSESDFSSNYRVHRIVFENILVDPENHPEGNDRSLSIPFDGKMRPVWAPNGYGKTFAFKLLSFLNMDPNDVWGNDRSSETKLGQRSSEFVIPPHERFFENFIIKCKQMLESQEDLIPANNAYKKPSDKFKETFNVLGISDRKQILTKQLVPFVRMKVRLVGTAKNHQSLDGSGKTQVVDISVKPHWDAIDYNSPSTNTFEYRKKFWSTESIDSAFFEKFADEELKLILLDKDYNSELSIREPVFLHDSFIFPFCLINFGNFWLSQWPHDEGQSVNDGLIDRLEDYIGDLITGVGQWYSNIYDDAVDGEFIEKDIGFSKIIHSTMVKLKDFYEMTIKEKEKILIDLIELNSQKYHLTIPSQHPLNEVSEIKNPSERDGIPLLCTLLDLEINGIERPNAIIDEPYYPFHLTSNHQNSPTSWRVFSGGSALVDELVISGEISNTPSEDESIVEALRMLSTCYFEIPSLINYSSESNLNNSQETMEYMLKSIRRECSEITNNNADYERVVIDNSAREEFFLPDPPSKYFMNFLKIISQRLGGGRLDVLDSFFAGLGIKFTHSYDLLLSELDGLYSGKNDDIFDKLTKSIQGDGYVRIRYSWDEHMDDDNIDYIWYMPDFTEPIWEDIAIKIIKFTEIYENINKTLDSQNSTSWSAMCRFKSLKNCMQFSDPANDFEIKQEHLSFGQKSVIVSEVCLGFSIFLDPKIGLLNYSSSTSSDFRTYADIQLNFIIDEPEIGRSEYWVNEVARRLIETSYSLEDNKSIMVVSHRESLLRSFNSDSIYHVMQPQESQNEEE